MLELNSVYIWTFSTAVIQMGIHCKAKEIKEYRHVDLYVSIYKEITFSLKDKSAFYISAYFSEG